MIINLLLFSKFFSKISFQKFGLFGFPFQAVKQNLYFSAFSVKMSGIFNIKLNLNEMGWLKTSLMGPLYLVSYLSDESVDIRSIDLVENICGLPLKRLKSNFFDF